MHRKTGKRIRTRVTATLPVLIAALACAMFPAQVAAQTSEKEIVDELVNKAGRGNGKGNGDGNGNQFCQIIVTEPGSLGSGFENSALSSKIYGGKPGSAQVTTTNGSYSLSIDAPLGFSASPAGGNQNVSMYTSFMGNGVTNFSETPGTIDIRLKRGMTVVETHLTAERTDSNPFPAGFYSAEVTLRCE